MNQKLTNLFQYIAILLQKYNELQAAQNVHPFRISSIKDTENGINVIFQVAGKATFLEVTAEEILNNDSFTSRFPSVDIRTLTNLLHQRTLSTKPQVEIISKKYDPQLNKIIVNFEDSQGNKHSKSAAEIITDEKTIQLLSSKDAVSIGYLAGYEHSQNTAHGMK